MVSAGVLSESDKVLVGCASCCTCRFGIADPVKQRQRNHCYKYHRRYNFIDENCSFVFILRILHGFYAAASHVALTGSAREWEHIPDVGNTCNVH